MLYPCPYRIDERSDFSEFAVSSHSQCEIFEFFWVDVCWEFPTSVIHLIRFGIVWFRGRRKMLGLTGFQSDRHFDVFLVCRDNAATGCDFLPWYWLDCSTFSHSTVATVTAANLFTMDQIHIGVSDDRIDDWLVSNLMKPYIASNSFSSGIRSERGTGSKVNNLSHWFLRLEGHTEIQGDKGHHQLHQVVSISWESEWWHHLTSSHTSLVIPGCSECEIATEFSACSVVFLHWS